MNKKPRTWLRRGAVWVWIALASALVIASACFKDTTAPRYVPDPEDTTADTSEVGFLILPGIQNEAWV